MRQGHVKTILMTLTILQTNKMDLFQPDGTWILDARIVQFLRHSRTRLHEVNSLYIVTSSTGTTGAGHEILSKGNIS